MELNFKEFDLPTGISGKKTVKVDARESFADMFYNRCPGMKGHALAHKIYESDGPVELNDDEVDTLTRLVEAIAFPAFIDGLRMQLEVGGNDNENI
ncbi:MAG: hypothetical protein LUE27_07055 [Clostridia bacterium]|nr:hypothetical protein [Clostridia bacterium]